MAEARAHCRKAAPALAAVIGALVLGGCYTDRTAGNRPAQVPATVVAAKLRQCAACHGNEGISSAAIFPDLAGQQNAYIAAQLTAFRDHTRQDRDAKTYMWGVATGLSDATIAAFAAHYATKTSAVAVGNDKVAAGAAIYAQGVAAHGVLPCVACHGPKANGNAVIPRLAGQHRDYLAVQLRAFASGSRDNAAMHLIAKGMTPEEVKDVTTYLASL